MYKVPGMYYIPLYIYIWYDVYLICELIIGYCRLALYRDVPVEMS